MLLDEKYIKQSLAKILAYQLPWGELQSAGDQENPTYAGVRKALSVL